MNQVIRIAVTAIWVLCVSTFSTPSMATKIQGGPDDKGGACHVVSGPNAGKSGVYSGDGFCCGTGGPSGEGWGCTECTGSNAGKCKDGAAKAGVIKPGILKQPGSNTIQKAR
jgi:hypothetical protein